MISQEVFNLVLGPLGAVVVLALAVFLFQGERVVSGKALDRERDRTDKVDQQADKMLDILNDILRRLELADEKEKWRHEGDREGK